MKRSWYFVLLTLIAVAGILGVVKWQVENMDIQPKLVVVESVFEEHNVEEHNVVIGGADCPGCKAIHEQVTEVVNFSN